MVEYIAGCTHLQTCPLIRKQWWNSTHDGQLQLATLSFFGFAYWIMSPQGKCSMFCFARKNTKFFYKAKIILKKINYGILAPCYYGSWCDSKRAFYKVHKIYGFVMTTLTIALKVKWGYMQHRYANCAYSMAYTRRKWFYSIHVIMLKEVGFFLTSSWNVLFRIFLVMGALP